MMNQKLEWFSAPRDVLPNTTITPGRLIVHCNNPEGPPYLERALPIPPEDLTAIKYKWSHEKEGERGGSLGIFASFMSGLVAGGDLSGDLTVGAGLKIDVNTLETLKFEPSTAYLQETLNLPKNLAFLGEKKWSPFQSMYIITGVKNAYGATLTRWKSTKLGADAGITVSPNVPGLDIGPKGSYSMADKAIETVHEPTDFVFAFRVNKVYYSRRKKQFTMEKHVKGAAYSYGDSDEFETPISYEAEHAVEHEDAVDVDGIDEDDAGEEEFEITGQTVIDEETNEPCVFIIPDADN